MKVLITVLTSLLAIACIAFWRLIPEQPAPIVTASVSLDPVPAAVPEFLPIPLSGAPPKLSADGYSGTSEVREEGAPRRATSPSAPGWMQTATEAQFPAVVAALANAPTYSDALQRMHQLAGNRQVVEVPPEVCDYTVYETRFQTDTARMVGLLMDALALATGVARQTLIFHLALALPDELAFMKLREIRATGDAADDTDAMCALAMRGDEVAMSEFEAWARRPDANDFNFLCDGYVEHDKLAREGRRDILRSYRCIELLDFRPYFQLHAWYCGRYAGAPFLWADRKAAETSAQRHELAYRLLPAWLQRFENHPGSDDMAWRLACMCCERKEWFTAAQWASCCATFPDQDMTAHGVELLVSLAECALEPYELDRLTSGLDRKRNPTLLSYIRLRRIAAEEGFERALVACDAIAASEPDSLLAGCYKARWAARAANGLDSGLQPLPARDPLRRAEGVMPDPQQYMNPVNRWGGSWHHMTNIGYTDEQRRLHPPDDAVQLPTARVTLQLRLWETLAELERRRDAAVGDERADLEYKIAAVYYHERDSIHPAYANYRVRNSMPRNIWYSINNGEPLFPDLDPMRYAGRRRAAALFEQLAADYPYWPGRDKALFSAAMAWIKLVDDRTVRYRDDAIRNGTALFERCSAEYPRSNLADDADSAASYWHRCFPEAWKEKQG